MQESDSKALLDALRVEHRITLECDNALFVEFPFQAVLAASNILAEHMSQDGSNWLIQFSGNKASLTYLYLTFFKKGNPLEDAGHLARIMPVSSMVQDFEAAKMLLQRVLDDLYDPTKDYPAKIVRGLRTWEIVKNDAVDVVNEFKEVAEELLRWSFKE